MRVQVSNCFDGSEELYSFIVINFSPFITDLENENEIGIVRHEIDRGTEIGRVIEVSTAIRTAIGIEIVTVIGRGIESAIATMID